MTQFEYIESAPNTFITIKTKTRIIYRLWARFFSFCFALICLILLAPALIIVAIITKADSPGPVFFRQMRTGKDGKRFPMLKFRTMYIDAEKRKKQLRKFSKLSYPDFKIENDPRVTRAGKLFRKLSLDELPNLLNVLWGDMNIVGPRPTSFPVECYEEWHKTRLKVTPGITGLWQISGRSNLDFDDRVKLDIAYINSQSILNDLKILFYTIPAVFNRHGAY